MFAVLAFVAFFALFVTGQSTQTVTFAWDLNSTHDGDVAFEVDVNHDPNAIFLCGNVQVLATERRCTATVPTTANVFRLRGVGKGAEGELLIGDWSVDVPADSGLPPGKFQITRHFEDTPDPPDTDMASRLFNGTTDRLESSGDVPTLDSLQKMTLSVWVRPSNLTTGNRHIVSKGGTSFQNTFSLQSTGGGSPGNAGILFATHTTSANFGASNNAVLSAGVWTHIVVLFDGTQAVNSTRLRIYVNGVNLAPNVAYTGTIPATLTDNAEKLKIAGDDTGDADWAGEIDDVAIWTGRILSDAQIAALAAGASPNQVLQTDLTHYWPLDGVSNPEPGLGTGGIGLVVTGTTTSVARPNESIPVRIQEKSLYLASNSVPITLDATPTEGNFLIAAVHTRAADLDDLVGWTRDAQVFNATSADALVFFSRLVGPSESATITFNPDTSDHTFVYVAEWTGLTQANVSAISGLSSTNSKTTGTTLAPTVADGVAIAAWGLRAGSTVSGYTNGFTERVALDQLSNGQLIVADKASTTLDPVESTATWATATGTIAGVVVYTTDAPPPQIDTDTILVVANPDTLTAGDTALKSRLEGLGLTVTVVGQSASEAGGAFKAIIVSESIATSVFGEKYKTSSKGIVLLDPASWDDFDMVPDGSSTTDTTFGAATMWEVPPLNAALSGDVTLYSPASRVDYRSGRAPGVSRIATRPTFTTHVMYIAAEAGAELTTGTAAGRRVGLSMMEASIPNLTTNGWALFDAAVRWAIGELVDLDLLVRYYLDEAASGTSPTQALDASGVGTAENLSIVYGTAMTYTESGGNRGLVQTDPAAAGLVNSAVALAPGNKLYDALHGTQKATIEFVGTFANADSTVGARVIAIGEASANGRLAVVHGFPTADDLTFRFNGVTNNGSMVLGATTGVRAVYHFVIDTTQAVADDRVRVFKNGTEVSLETDHASYQIITQNANLSLSGGTVSFTLMNRPDQARALEGTLFYAALYDRALSDAEVAHNTAILALDDDTPVVAVEGIVPTATVTAGGWTAQGGAGSLHAALADENDATFIRSSTGAGSDVAEVSFGTVNRTAGDPPIAFTFRHRRTP